MSAETSETVSREDYKKALQPWIAQGQTGAFPSETNKIALQLLRQCEDEKSKIQLLQGMEEDVGDLLISAGILPGETLQRIQAQILSKVFAVLLIHVSEENFFLRYHQKTEDMMADLLRNSLWKSLYK